MKWMAIVFAAALLACGGKSAEKAAEPETKAPAAPTTAEARTLLDSAPELGEFEFTNAAYTLPLETPATGDALTAARDLARDGWLKVAKNGDVDVTDKAKNDRRFLVRPNGYLDIVPLAKKELVGDVTAVRQNADGTVDADFTFRWVPNELGSAFRSGPVHERYAAASHPATATFIHNGTSWTVLKITRRE